MASIKKIEGKRGPSYKITVSQGTDSKGRQVRRYKTWVPPVGMTSRKADKEVQRVALEFEQEISMGLRTDKKQTFREYAEYTLKVKEMEGAKPSTLGQLQSSLERIYPAIGHLPLRSITPQHLNRLWQNLSEPGMNLRAQRATATDKLIGALRGAKRSALLSAAGISKSTLTHALGGGRISLETARKLAAAAKMDIGEAFTLHGGEATLAPGTIRLMAKSIGIVFELAIKEGLILSNPVPRSALPKAHDKEAPHYEPPEITDLFAALEEEPEQWRTLVHFLIASGCRRGEACALKWSKLDFHSGTVTIDASLVPVPGKGIIEGSTKTGKSRRLTLPGAVLAMLRHHRAAQAEKRLAIGELWTGTEDYVFTRSNGEAMSPDYVSAWIAKFAKRHNLPPLHTHELRHTAASLLIGQGVDIVEVSRRLGHSNTATTLNIYAHALERADKAAADAIGEALYDSGGKK